MFARMSRCCVAVMFSRRRPIRTATRRRTGAVPAPRRRPRAPRAEPDAQAAPSALARGSPRPARRPPRAGSPRRCRRRPRPPRSLDTFDPLAHLMRRVETAGRSEHGSEQDRPVIFRVRVLPQVGRQRCEGTGRVPRIGVLQGSALAPRDVLSAGPTTVVAWLEWGRGMRHSGALLIHCGRGGWGELGPVPARPGGNGGAGTGGDPAEGIRNPKAPDLAGGGEVPTPEGGSPASRRGAGFRARSQRSDSRPPADIAVDLGG